MTTWIKNNLAALLSFFVVLFTAVQAMKDFGLISDLQFAALVLSSVAVIIVPLVKGRWAGALKTGLDIVGAVIVILIPFIALWITGAPLTKNDVALIGLAILKALATEFGVQVRTDWGATTPSKLIDAGVSEKDAKSAAPVITVLPATTVHQTSAGPVVIGHPDLPTADPAQPANSNV